MTPGTKVFYGEPLMYEHPSKTVANAYTVDGEISGWFSLTALRILSAVSWTPFST